VAVILTPEWSSIPLWWETTNLMGIAIGDLDLLDPSIDPQFGGATNDNLVSAINSVAVGSNVDQRLMLVRAIAMS
jgi:hypothetical protein